MYNKLAIKKTITLLLVVLLLAIGVSSPAIHDGQTISAAYVEETPVRVAYLTFDDGPFREITPYILDILRKEGIRATFFVLPHEGVDDIYWRIINEGHELGNHSYTHNFYRLYESPIEVFTSEVERAHEFILNRFGYRMTSFRFPGGPFGRPAEVFEERREIVTQMGYREFSWHVDSNDWRKEVANRGPQELAGRVLYYTEGREHLILLFHDVPWATATLEALPYIITGLREQGYIFDIVRNYPFNEEERILFREHHRKQREIRWRDTLRKILLAENKDWLISYT